MYYPTLEQIYELKQQGNLVPIYQEIQADEETPVSVYRKVARPPYSFLLESVEGGDRLGRYSFIGTEPYSVCKTGPDEELGAVDPLLPIQQELERYTLVPIPGLPRFHGGAVGYLSYDAVHYFEPRVPISNTNSLGLPESFFMLNDTLLIIDHLRHTIKIVSHVHLNGDIDMAYKEATGRIDAIVNRIASPIEKDFPTRTTGRSEITSNFSRERYHSMVERVKEYIRAGDIIQAVPSQRLVRPTDAHPFQIYSTLRKLNPSPYMFYLQLGSFQIIGASPEMLLRVEQDKVTTHPIAGTRPRGTDPKDDTDLEKELIDSPKERAEHIMLVDLGRNDVGRVSKIGTVKVTRLMGVDRYSHVMHLVSEVTGELKSGFTTFDAMRACFPVGTLSGAPKIRAMEIINEMEQDQRGPYGGAVGYFSYSGNTDTATTIRTIILKDGLAYVQAGGGIVADSDPESEYQETLHKAGALLRAIDKAEGH